MEALSEVGYIDDARNTDNAWLEARCMHYHCTPELARKLALARADASISTGLAEAEAAVVEEVGALRWLQLDSAIMETVEQFSPRHRALVLLAVSRWQSRDATGA